ncbi:UNVERIFIED_ORG: beta-lactamase superfamily II metal-dependent hydrolase [Rhizobium esperanzae]
MTNDLRIRIYNVLFGDAILLTIPEIDDTGEEVTVNVLIDVGNALAGTAGRDEVFEPILRNIRDELGGAPVDLYIMTHEHMDHVQGLLHGATKLEIEFKARHVWMTASSEGEAYYNRFPDAKQKRLATLAAYDSIAAFLAKSAAPAPAFIQALLDINNPRSTKDCIKYISERGLDGSKPRYVHRTADITGHHPFQRTKIRLLAPEEDTSIYYGALPPRTLGGVSNGAAPFSLDAKAITPPAGVSAGHFFDLVEFRSSGMSANLRAIDKAANNSSIAIELEWNGWRMLFPGDAEEKSWEMMDQQNDLKPVHFLKVSHHGSRNGSPRHQLDKLLPEQGPDGPLRFAVVSTRDGAYSGVPDTDTLEFLKSRAQVADTRELKEGGWIDVIFPASGDRTPTFVRGNATSAERDS